LPPEKQGKLKAAKEDSPVGSWPGDVGLVCLALAAFYVYPLLAPGLEYRGGDPVLMSYPYRFLFRESVRQGVLPLWNPYAGCGIPALAAYQGAFLYPVHWLSLAIPSIGFACRLTLFLHFLLQGAGTYGLARFGFGLGRPASVFAGLAFGVSAFNAAHVEQFMIVAAASWTPLVLCGWIHFLRRPGARPLLATVICLAMAILSGHSQYWLYALDLMALLAIIQPVEAEWGGFWAAIRRRIVALGGLGLVGAAAFLLTAAQLLPTLELAGYSERAIDPADYGEASSFPPSYFSHYLFPGRLGVWNEPFEPERNPVEMACFVGRVTLVLAGLGLLGLARRAGVRALAVWTVAAAILALGRHGPFDGGLFRLAEAIFPGWKGLRVPARLLFVANLGLVLLAGHGLDWIGTFVGKWWRRRAAGAPRRAALTVSPVAALCCVLVVAEQVPVSWRLPLRHPTPKAALLPAASLQAFFAQRSGEYRVFRLIDPVNIYRADSEAEAARVATVEPNTGVYSGVGTVRAYVEGLVPLLRTEDFLRAYWRNLYTPQPDAELLGLMNVRYLAADKPVAAAGWEIVAWIAPCEDGRRYIAVHQNAFARERVFWAAEVERTYDLKALDGAYVSTGIPSPAASEARPLPRLEGFASSESQPSLSVRQLTANRLRIVKPPGACGDMLLAASPYPGWTAQWEGRSAPLVAENAIHSRFRAPSGVERIDLAFQPFSFRLGLFLSLASWGALAAAPWLTRRGRRF